MPHSSRRESGRADHNAFMAGFYAALRTELAAAWICATAPLKTLFESVLRDGIPPPTTLQGLPPGQFPPLDDLKDELIGQAERPTATGRLTWPSNSNR